ncbi:MAG: UDP-N-acetylmuramoyl-L-alanyl-D-glutamate--2,6-diaminopimelate ligase [Bacteroidales bacterium]|nr:UDP-N-acetylmuramoyl-L-alanyl-D-glutamate--2,6-diaminopimelate ligase [Bacteroidales bacterium]MBR5920894.1 UDP-N-acetylmuramoyl-L-alanyl-D-glutamate--2,6-diaminopimelate ligase [Bacteroidales bacterium]
MKPLDILLKSLRTYTLTGTPELNITEILFDSRAVSAQPDGSTQLYVAQRGTQTDGHKYIASAIKQGCRAVVCEELPETLADGVCYIKVADSSVALGMLADAFYGHPSRKLKLVGITGTNGKTTTVTLLHRLFMNAGHPTGLISTIVNKIGNEEVPTNHTTPDAVELNRLLAKMVEEGCEYCFMEVSSHALCQHRVTGLRFAGALFSNITHDHLDFHKTFANYIAAKKSFFDKLPKSAFALTNIDDKNGRVMVQNCKAAIHTYSLRTAADFRGVVMENAFTGLHLRVNGHEVYFKLCGKFNAYNLLAIYGAAVLLGMDEMEALTLMSGLDSAAGRFQMMRTDEGATAIVDYAHTPDALENVLKTIRDIVGKDAEVLTVVGCGGDRDALKRPEMAEIACKYSSKVILTSDNPRTEDPQAILDDMLKGVPAAKSKQVVVIENRREAIKTACMMLQPKGVLLVAGKGHENYQEINHVKHHFDDTEEIKNCLNIQ